MLLISHRGNVIGPNPEKENSPSYILEAAQHFDVEIDVWFDNGFYLGHERPTYPIGKEFLTNSKFWCHAKNIEALAAMLSDNRIHCFWHQSDDVILTSKQYIWTYPGKQIASQMAIAVVPELVKSWDISKAVGVCSDYVTNQIYSVV
jgi:hypothetical protein